MYKPSTLPNSRIDAADVLRGFAIAGIILIHFLEHMNFYSFPELTKLDENVWDTIFFLFAGKMYAIFAMLFGLSFFIQHDNQAQKGKDFRPRFVWRMVLLMLFGLLDLMFYNGDILFIYAVCGLLIIPFIRCSNKVLNWIILILMIQPIEVISTTAEKMKVAIKYTSETNDRHFGYTNLLSNYLGGTHVQELAKTITATWIEFVDKHKNLKPAVDLHTNDYLVGI